jgi:ParB-like chromosome segregation protein Spo0J
MSKNVEIIGLRDLKPDPQNARKHAPRNVAMVVDALQEVGAARSIVIDEEGVVLAGNATIKAAGKAGLARVKVVDADGSEIIAVRRRNLTARPKKRRLTHPQTRASSLRPSAIFLV